ncbi:eukaryotic aspartyl protease family protein [Tasmannia lanceolata]|uniref:eukaryotic aspartyl protease family protein n=1 Tax=Tasmannia lanceolata TaxID=3420 RepID=UPI004064B9FE
METRFNISLLTLVFLLGSCHCNTFSSKFIHRFSDEAHAVRVSRKGEFFGQWPRQGSRDYYRHLASSDLQRQKMKLGTRYQSLFPSEGSKTLSFGNDLGWLHYTWIDIGTPNVSFLVALDTGSDLFWVPCDCIECAPLSTRDLDRDLSVYRPSQSSTGKHLPCDHVLCESGSNCKSPKQPCPYISTYTSENTSSSGFLVEDTLYLASNSVHASTSTVQTPVVIGCGRKQSGGYLEGIAPDGVLGLGFGNISVPSFLAKAGLVRNSFSMCFAEDYSGRISFGDQGLSTQQSTPFLTLNGNYPTYIVGVESFCIGSACLKQTSFQALVDSGSSFTYLPNDVYERVTAEFDGQMNASRFSFEPWEYCYNSSSLDLSKIVPTLSLIFAGNSSFVAVNPIVPYSEKEDVLTGFCLALESTSDNIGSIGQNLMTGYRIVFDRENLKLGWSRSNCIDLTDGMVVPLTPPPHNISENPLPTNEQQSSPGGHAVPPAVAGRAPSNLSAAPPQVVSLRFGLMWLLLLCLAISSHTSWII